MTVDLLAQTHEVLNQPSALENFNAYTSDDVLQHWIIRFGGGWGKPALEDYGAKVGGDLLRAGFQANKFKPEFHCHDRFGHRVDLVEYHPSYHQLMASAIEAQHTSLPWNSQKSGRHAVRAGIAYLHTQADPGSGCPLTMTFACVPAISKSPALAQYWLPKILSQEYDGRNVPYYDKTGVTIGMAMTEKQGGSDVRANTTKATAIGEDELGQCFSLVGHKWFCSAPMCDAFLVLAYTQVGLSCFLVPRWRPDGSKNPMQIQRLKDKLGNVSNASSEVEFRCAFGWLAGKEGKGVSTILQMVALTRFDCMVGSSAIMGQAAMQAIHHTSGRQAFGKPLHQQPIMLNVLADLALEAEAALAISMRMAHSLENQGNPHEQGLLRLGTALGKYWICKRAPQQTYEAMESIGAVGLIKDNVLSRLYAEAPVNAIWEGSGNIQCLDVLRVLGKEPEITTAFIAELTCANSSNQDYANYVEKLSQALADISRFEANARMITEQMALAWQAATLLKYGDSQVAEVFIDSRLKRNSGNMYGTLASNFDHEYLVKRVQPKV